MSFFKSLKAMFGGKSEAKGECCDHGQHEMKKAKCCSDDKCDSAEKCCSDEKTCSTGSCESDCDQETK